MQISESVVRPRSATVIGLGYVGLPTAVLLAQGGVHTVGVDINEDLLTSLRAGSYAPKEPGLADLLRQATASGMLQYNEKISSTDAYIIAVPTPINEDKSPGMQYVLAATESIAKVIEPGQLVILESTSPPGATKLVATRISEIRPDLDVSGSGKQAIKFAYCPERVLPGNAIQEIVHNERLIGGLTPESAEMAEMLYKSFTKGTTVLCTDSEAEMAKLVENSYRDVNIAFANEVARIATKLGVHADKVISLANRHPRVNILSPGVGVGGHCISVDPWFLVDAAPESAQLITSARNVNDLTPLLHAKDIIKILESNEYSEVWLLGLAYKPDSDDLRESPSIVLAEALFGSTIENKINLVDPGLSSIQVEKLKSQFQNIYTYLPKLGSGHLVVLLVDHKEFQNWNFGESDVIRIYGTGQVIQNSTMENLNK